MNTNPIKSNAEIIELIAIQETIDRSFARIEFDSNGYILDVNQNFIDVFGYTTKKKVIGQHHSIFVDPSQVNMPNYKKFWDDLRSNIVQKGEFKRISKNGNPIWIRAAYTPVLDKNGTLLKIIKVATDITIQKELAIEMKGLKSTIDRSFAQIEFDAEGYVLDANQNFIDILGYTELEEIKGQHHSIFVNPTDVQSRAYKKFWDDLRQNIIQDGEFERITKQGEPLWIRAAYTPVLDDQGDLLKIIKIAADITEEKRNSQIIQGQYDAIMEMAAPISKIWEGILLLPIVGIMDSQRSEEIMRSMLHKISTTQAKAFIIDISGIAIMDTATANHLMKITQASRLMGCVCLISGISPNVAQTIIELGIDIKDIITTNNMQAALKRAFRITGQKI